MFFQLHSIFDEAEAEAEEEEEHGDVEAPDDLKPPEDEDTTVIGERLLSSPEPDEGLAMLGSSP